MVILIGESEPLSPIYLSSSSLMYLDEDIRREGESFMQFELMIGILEKSILYPEIKEIIFHSPCVLWNQFIKL